MIKVIKVFRIILVIFMVFNTGVVIEMIFRVDKVLSDFLVFTMMTFMYETRKIYNKGE